MFFSMLFIKLQWHCEHFLPQGVFKCYFIKDQILSNSHSSRPKLHAVKVVEFGSLILCPKGRISLILSSVQRRELASYKTFAMETLLTKNFFSKLQVDTEYSAVEVEFDFVKWNGNWLISITVLNRNRCLIDPSVELLTRVFSQSCP